MAKKTTAKAVKPARKTTEVAVVKAAVAAVASVDPQSLLRHAIDKNLPIEQMERLLTMRREMKAEWARDQYFAALSGFQADCPIIEKKHKVSEKKKSEQEIPKTRYTYAALEDLVEPVRPYLEKWGFSYTFKSQQDKDAVTAICHAHHRDGHEEVNSFTAPIDHDAYMSDPQKVAAALTFSCRYAFKGAFGVQTRGEDRDENLPEPKLGDRKPIQQPQPRNVTPASSAETTPLGDYEKILKFLQATEVDPTTKLPVRLFNENELLDYTAAAGQAENEPETLKAILAYIIATGKKRRAAVKGE
jgi:hypothetical protein